MGERYHNATSTVVLNCIEDVDVALKEIGTLELQIRAIDDAADKKIKKLQEDAKAKGAADRSRIQELSAKIEAYACLHEKDLFKDGKTKDLTFGSFGYRQSTKTSTKRDSLDKLKSLCSAIKDEMLASNDEAEKKVLQKRFDNLASCINITEKLNKTDLRNLEASDQKAIGVKVIVEDTFFCESKSMRVNQELLKKA